MKNRLKYLLALIGCVTFLAAAIFVARPSAARSAPLARPGLEDSDWWVAMRHGLHRSGVWSKPVTALALDPKEPSRCWAAAGRSIYAWDKEGEEARVAQLTSEILCLEVDPQVPGRLLAGTSRALYEVRILKEVFQIQLLLSYPISDLCSDPADGARWYLLSKNGLFVSNDCGETWAALTLPMTAQTEDPQEESNEAQPEEPSSEELPRLLFWRGSLYLVQEGLIHLSLDFGRSWQVHPMQGLGRTKISTLAGDPNGSRLYGAGENRVFLFDPGLGRWMPLTIEKGINPGKIQSVWVAPQDGSVWIAAENGFLRVSNDQASRRLGSSLPAEESPSIQEVHAAVIRYAEVHPQKIRHWRAMAQWRNFFPKFSVGLDQDTDTTVTSSTTQGVTRFNIGPEQKSFGLNMGLTWDLGNLVWNPDQTSIDVRSRLMVQLRQDLLEEATRLYFERKKLQAQFLEESTEDPVLARQRELRIEELTALLDALTGGAFSGG